MLWKMAIRQKQVKTWRKHTSLPLGLKIFCYHCTNHFRRNIILPNAYSQELLCSLEARLWFNLKVIYNLRGFTYCPVWGSVPTETSDPKANNCGKLQCNLDGIPLALIRKEVNGWLQGSHQPSPAYWQEPGDCLLRMSLRKPKYRTDRIWAY